MKNQLLFLVCIFMNLSVFAGPSDFSIANSFAPKKKQSDGGFDKTRLLIGPGLGLGAAQRAFSFNLNPTLGYALTDNLSAGFSLGFSYFQQTIDYNNSVTNKTDKFRYKVPTYTVGLFARYMIANMIIVGVEPEISNTKFYTGVVTQNSTTGKLTESSSRLTVPSFLVGGGYGQRVGNYGYYYFMGMYDLVQNPNARAYYETIAIRVGIMFPLFNQ